MSSFYHSTSTFSTETLLRPYSKRPQRIKFKHACIAVNQTTSPVWKSKIFFSLTAAALVSATFLWQNSISDQPLPYEIATNTLPTASISDTAEIILPQFDEIAPPPPVTQPTLFEGPILMELEVAEGDTLLSLLQATGIEDKEAHAVIAALRPEFNPKKLFIGQRFQVTLDQSQNNPELPTITSITLPISVTQTVTLNKTNNEYSVAMAEEVTQAKKAYFSAPIRGSFYETGLKNGLTPALLSDLIKAYSYEVDFQRDIKRGHNLEVVFEKMYTEGGDFAGTGDVLYAALDLGGKAPIRLYRYEDKNGNADYYDASGESLRKALLKTPIDGARISSGFGMRHHPVLGYNKMHKGVDFAAGTGTPIYAAGDGVIDYAGRKGGYGNYVRIKHNGTYATAYAHASRIAKGIKNGTKVRQGQVIAYVGTTGRSTGPHLHYEILQNGVQVNPKSVKFKTGKKLEGRELASFKKSLEQLQAYIKENAKVQVAALSR